MKKLFIAIIILMICVSAIVLGTTRAFGVIDTEGYAIPADAGIVRALAGEGSAPIPLAQLHRDDEIYKAATGCYVGADRKKIDLAYPLYTNGGTGLRFFGEDNWLLTADVDLFKSYNGLYVSDGVSYNADMTQADDAEFILLALGNGLYMNVQQAVFENRLERAVIPINSILSLREGSIAWFEQNNGTLSYHEVQSVFEAAITIGEHTYNYTDLLDALGLIREVIDHTDSDDKPDPDKLQQAETILNKKGSGGGKKSTAGDNTAEGTTDKPSGSGSGENAGNTTGGETVSGSTGSSGAGGGSSTGSGGSGGSGGSSGSGSSAEGGGSGSGGGTTESGGIPGGGEGGGSASGGGTENPGQGEGGEGGEGGESEPAPYETPKITLGKIDPWCYALGLDMSVNDPSGAIVRGVNFSVFRGVKGSGSTGTDSFGHTTYPSDSFKGTSTLLRRSKTGSQQFALSVLEPGSTVYLQYQYRYNAEEERDGIKVKVRKYYYSDLIKIELPTVEAGGVKAVLANWTEEFAAKPDAITLDNLTLANTSGYIADAEHFDFDNMKLNTLPYVNRLELTMTPKAGGQSTTVVVGSGTLNKAQQPGGTTFTSSSPKLQSNTEYTYTVAAKDRYGNTLPLQQGNDITHAVFTRKATPTVTITETENTMGSFAFTVKVRDPDGALTGDPLRLQVSNTRNGITTPAGLYGTWDLGHISAGGENVTELQLLTPKDGKTYAIRLDSLAFARLYKIDVTGDYHPRPDAAAAGTLPVLHNELFGSLTVYTASLSSGLITFQSSVSDLKDTSATLNATMTGDTTIDILELVDEFRLKLTDDRGKAIQTVTLKKTELDRADAYPYLTEEAAVELQAGSAATPRTILYGTQDKYRYGNPWESLLIHEQLVEGETPEETKTELTTPMQLRVMLPEKSLTCYTDYNYIIEAVVKKSGEEYLIPVNMTNTRFTTKKTLPVVEYKDLFLAADIAEFLDLRINDPDGTILNDGDVTVYLYYGNTILSAKKMKANDTPQNLRFEGLIKGAEYTLKFVAAAYNDADGYGSYRSNYVLQSYNLVGGSALSGTLTLQQLGIPNGAAGKNLVDFDQVYAGYLDNNKVFYARSPYERTYRTYWMRCKPDTEYIITVPMGAKHFFRIASDTGTVDWTKLPTDGSCKIPNLTKYYQADPPEYTQKTVTFTTGPEDTYLIVSLGRLEGGTLTENAIHSQLAVRKYDPAAIDSEYTAELRATVNDSRGYLGRPGESGKVHLTVLRSDSMELPEYTDEYLSEDIELIRNEDGTLSVDYTEVLRGLPLDKGWQATLTATYQGSQVVLDTITFRTDGDYITVTNHREMIEAMRRNPYGHILVVNDFVQDQNTYATFYGTIDFQGHVITKGENITTVFLYLNSGAKAYNLVYDLPHVPVYVNPYWNFICGSDCLLENFILRTYGQVEVGYPTPSGASGAYTGLIGHLNYSGATLRNFIVQLGGDLVANGDAVSYGALTYGVMGVCENGYVYGKNGAGFVTRGTGTRQLFSVSYYQEHLKNVYVLLDTWVEPEQESTTATLCAFNSGNMTRVRDCYTVGDYYKVGRGESRTYLLPSTTVQNLLPAGTKSIYKNVWALTGRNYQNLGPGLHGGLDKLYDIDWQKSILGDGFAVEDSLTMGFYPRVNLPSVMQKYQEYIPLPVLDDTNAPKLVSDEWAGEENDPTYPHGMDNGYIRLRLRNDKNYPIGAVTIEGLKTSVVNQGTAADGLYDVILQVAVDPDPNKAQYVSSYNITGMIYTTGSGSRETRESYTTTGIEFWKAVATAQDWADINTKMGWNYRLTADIDFAKSGLTLAQIIINGSITNYQQNTMFTGKLDGDEHIVSNIKLQNLTCPYLFYTVSGEQGGIIKNLLVENLEISCAKLGSREAQGLVGTAMKGANLSNIRMKNCRIAGGGKVGMLVGNINQSTVTGCSVADSTLTDIENGQQLYAGGLIGYAGTTSIQSCYTRNLTIEITNTVTVRAIGGLVAYQGSGIVQNCYSNGSIKASGNYIGGLVGEVTGGDNANSRQNWTYVDILQSSGNVVGGSHGRMRDTYSTVVLGNVAGTGEDIGRFAAQRYSIFNTPSRRLYYYEGQTINIDDKKANVSWLLPLTGAQLGTPATWQDMVRLGPAWNYEPVKTGNAPQVLLDCTREGWQQKEIPLPGQGTDPVLEIQDAKHLNDPKHHYQLLAKLTHTGLTGEQIMELYEKGEFTIELDGMDLSEAARKAGRTEITLAPVGTDPAESDATTIRITTDTFQKAFDLYPLHLRYTEPETQRERELTVLVQYKESNGDLHRAWWEVSNLTEWNAVVREHGKTEENVRITGWVDFGGKSTDYTELVFNRLVGQNKESCGFENLIYTSSQNGIPWMTKVSLELSNLTFRNMKYNYQYTTVVRSMTGAITTASGVSNIVLDGMDMTVGNYNNGYVGFISTSPGIIDGVTMKNINITDNGKKTGRTYRYYCGGLVGLSSHNVCNVTATDVTVNMPFTSYVGGICGQQNAYGGDTGNNTLENVDVTGRTDVGGLMGYCVGWRTTGSKVVNGSVTGYSIVGGFYGIQGMTGRVLTDHADWWVEKVTITATASTAGGITGQAASVYCNNPTVKDCVINGGAVAGGIVGSINSGYGNTYQNVNVIGCTIGGDVTQDVAPNAMGFGGVVGVIWADTNTDVNPTFRSGVVRNCTIEGQKYVGGWVGSSTSIKKLTFDDLYVAEDVTIRAHSRAAGGLIGLGDNVSITNCAVGAAVQAGSGAGGIMGEMNLRNEDILSTIATSYYRGTVIAESGFAGGVVGRLNSGTVRFSDTVLNNVLVAADVRSDAEPVSLWGNWNALNSSAGTGLVYICEDSLLNGQSAKAIAGAAAAEGKLTDVTPQRPLGETIQLLRPANDFRTKSFYTGLGFGEKPWDLSTLTPAEGGEAKYMPFTRTYDSTSKKYLDPSPRYAGSYQYPDTIEAVSVGIPLPAPGEIGQETVVYASAVDRINIEKAVPEGTAGGVTVNVNGKDYTTNENGVLALRYRFGQAITVDDVPYQADKLLRRVMTYGDYWYYFGTDGTVTCGKASGTITEMKEYQTITGITGKVVHLWQGKALTADGTIYTLNGSDATPVEETVPEELKQVDALPYWNGKALVYHSYSHYKGANIPYRVFMLGENAYTVAPSQHTVYDGVVLSARAEFGTEKRYFALLGEDGRLTAYLTAMKLGSAENANISHISNNLGYSGTVLMICYNNGGIIGVDYTGGDIICSTLTTRQSFGMYVRSMFKGLFGSGYTGIQTDGSFMEGEETRTKLDDPSGGGSEGSGFGGTVLPEEPGSAIGGSTELLPGEGTTASGLPGEGGSEGSGSGQGTRPIEDPVTGEPTDGTAAGGSEIGAAMEELFGPSMLAYSEKTGRYELLDTAGAAAGEELTRKEALEKAKDAAAPDEKDNTAEPDDQAEKKDSFLVAWWQGRSLNAEERQGFILIAAAAAAGIAVLIILYRVVIRKRKQ